MNKYHLLYQKPYFCAIACLQMILFRHTQKLFSQEEMAWYFDVKVAPKLSEIYKFPFGHLTKHGNDEGVSTMDLDRHLARFFELNNIRLRATAYHASPEFLTQLNSWITNHLEWGNDLWVEYTNGSREEPKSLHIHDSLIEKYDPQTGIVTLLDPNPDTQNLREMPLSELAQRISGAYGKLTGIMLIEQT